MILRPRLRAGDAIIIYRSPFSRPQSRELDIASNCSYDFETPGLSSTRLGIKPRDAIIIYRSLFSQPKSQNLKVASNSL
jgi:hypothetical protein